MVPVRLHEKTTEKWTAPMLFFLFINVKLHWNQYIYECNFTKKKKKHTAIPDGWRLQAQALAQRPLEEEDTHLWQEKHMRDQWL